MMPLFSAMNTRPFGANSIDIGSVRPVKAADCWKPGGSVAPCAAPAPQRHGADGGKGNGEPRAARPKMERVPGP